MALGMPGDLTPRLSGLRGDARSGVGHDASTPDRHSRSSIDRAGHRPCRPPPGHRAPRRGRQGRGRAVFSFAFGRSGIGRKSRSKAKGASWPSHPDSAGRTSSINDCPEDEAGEPGPRSGTCRCATASRRCSRRGRRRLRRRVGEIPDGERSGRVSCGGERPCRGGGRSWSTSVSRTTATDSSIAAATAAGSTIRSSSATHRSEQPVGHVQIGQEVARSRTTTFRPGRSAGGGGRTPSAKACRRRSRCPPGRRSGARCDRRSSRRPSNPHRSPRTDLVGHGAATASAVSRNRTQRVPSR